MTESATFLLRIDPEVKQKLKERAAARGRSLNSYLNYLLNELVQGGEEDEDSDNPESS